MKVDGEEAAVVLSALRLYIAQADGEATYYAARGWSCDAEDAEHRARLARAIHFDVTDALTPEEAK